MYEKIILLLQNKNQNIYKQRPDFSVMDIKEPRTKRETRTNSKTSNLGKHVSFSALNNSFQLRLYLSNQYLGSKPKITYVGSNGDKQNFKPEDAVYKGFDIKDITSKAFIMLTEGEMIGFIKKAGFTFHIEPLWRHNANEAVGKTVIYKGTSYHASFFNYGKNETESKHDVYSNKNETTGNKYLYNTSRAKRQANSHAHHLVYCDTIALIDYDTYHQLGRNSINYMSNLVLFWYEILNYIFLDQSFNTNKIVGITLREIQIHTIYNESSEFNRLGKVLGHYVYKHDANSTIQSIAQELKSTATSFCLVSFITVKSFTTDLCNLQTAYIDKSKSYLFTKGVCGRTGYRLDDLVPTNIIITSLRPGSVAGVFYSETLVIRNLLHAVGHAFGATHDPINKSCSPDIDKGGKYVMFQKYSWEPITPNSFNFSECSSNQIFEIIENRRPCFKDEASTKFECGNLILEGREECDDGHYSKCCTKACRFVENAVCSPIHEKCCTYNCTIAEKGSLCNQALANRSCYSRYECNGEDSTTCTPEDLVPNYSNCGQFGQRCMNGVCSDFCLTEKIKRNISSHLFGLCFNENENYSDMCTLHCGIHGEECHKTSVIFPDSSECAVGRCFDGKCATIEERLVVSDRPEPKTSPFNTYPLYIGLIFLLPVLYFLALTARVRRQQQKKISMTLRKRMDPLSAWDRMIEAEFPFGDGLIRVVKLPSTDPRYTVLRMKENFITHDDTVSDDDTFQTVIYVGGSDYSTTTTRT